jgi:hypothetical protein
MGTGKINTLLQTIEDASVKFNSKLPAIEKKILNEISLLMKDFSVKNGKILSNMDNLKLLNKIKGKLERLVFSKEYVKDVSDFVRAYSTVAGIQNNYFKALDKNFKAKDYYSALKQVAIDSTIEGLTESGVRANVIKPVTDLLLTGITSGQSYAQMEETLRKTLTETADGAGALSRYAKTYTIDSINQFSAEYMTAISSDLGYEWFAYRGTNLETTREFCKHMKKKEYVHKSEFPEILKGKINGHQCRIYEKTGLPYGMKEGTNVDNFTANRGGWNCGHQLVPLREESVPESIRNKLQYSQKEGIVGKKEFEPLANNGLLADPAGVNSFLHLIDFMRQKAAPQLRKIAFEKMLANEKYIRENDVFYMNGSKATESEKQVAQKLKKAGFFVVFPGKGQIKEIKVLEGDISKRKNDVYIYDKITYAQKKVDLKSSGEPSVKSIAYHVSSGSGQAPVIALDITGKISKKNLISGIRSGWNKGIKEVLINYKGQWYSIDKKKAFGNWIELNLK